MIESDLAPAAWIEPLLVPGSFEVRMTAPQGFESYARIFFPFIGGSFDRKREVVLEDIGWSDLARRNGHTVHALMERETTAVGPDGVSSYDRCRSSPSAEQLDALVPILAHNTSSTSAWFLLWEGFGDLDRRVFDDAPKVSHAMRNFHLLRGPLAAFEQFPHAPGYWWPEDRAWCVCTDIDFAWAYVAGSTACVHELLSIPAIDAVETKPENPARSGMDVINAPDGRVRRSP